MAKPQPFSAHAAAIDAALAESGKWVSRDDAYSAQLAAHNPAIKQALLSSLQGYAQELQESAIYCNAAYVEYYRQMLRAPASFNEVQRAMQRQNHQVDVHDLRALFEYDRGHGGFGRYFSEGTFEDFVNTPGRWTPEKLAETALQIRGMMKECLRLNIDSPEVLIKAIAAKVINDVRPPEAALRDVELCSIDPAIVVAQMATVPAKKRLRTLWYDKSTAKTPLDERGVMYVFYEQLMLEEFGPHRDRGVDIRSLLTDRVLDDFVVKQEGRMIGRFNAAELYESAQKRGTAGYMVADPIHEVMGISADREQGR